MTAPTPIQNAQPEQIAFAAEDKFSPMGFMVQDFTHEAALGTSPDRILDPDYWRNVVKRPDFRGGGIIRCLCESPAYFAELLIREVNPFAGIATVALLRRIDLPEAHSGVERGLPAEHSVQYLGPKSRWALLRGKQTIKDNFENKAAAVDYGKEIGRTVAK